MRVQLSQWGNSAAVRLPKAVLDQLRFGVGAELDIVIHEGELHLRPVRPVARYRLEDLLEQITPDNVPPFESWPPAGREVIDDDYAR